MTSSLRSIWSSQTTLPRAARSASTRSRHLGRELGRVRRTRAEDELRGGIDVAAPPRAGSGTPF